jgi:hypothetical protein
MKKHSFTIIALVLVLLAGVAAFSAGCATDATITNTGAGVVIYKEGTLETTLNHGLDQVTKAAEAAIGNLKFAKISEKSASNSVVLIARGAEQRRIEIKLASVTDNSVKLSIRVGVFGEEKSSHTVLEAIKDNL